MGEAAPPTGRAWQVWGQGFFCSGPCKGSESERAVTVQFADPHVSGLSVSEPRLRGPLAPGEAQGNLKKNLQLRNWICGAQDAVPEYSLGG